MQWKFISQYFHFLTGMKKGLSALYFTVILPNFKHCKQISDHNCFNTFLSTVQNYGSPFPCSTGKEKLLCHLIATVLICYSNITENVQNHLTGQLMNTLFLAVVCSFMHFSTWLISNALVLRRELRIVSTT